MPLKREKPNSVYRELARKRLERNELTKVLTIVDQAVLRPVIICLTPEHEKLVKAVLTKGQAWLPECQVWICISVVMLGNVGSSLVAGRVASDALRIWILIDSDIVDPHGCGKKRSNSSQVQSGESV